MKLIPNDRKKLVQAALSKIECDIIIKDVNIVNVFTNEIYKGNIGMIDGFIAFIEESSTSKYELKAARIIDGNNKYAIPGLMDAHMHIESSMMTPINFAKAVLPLGTTTVFADPHEAANVKGVEAVKYFIRQSENLPMRQYYLIPSCVPSVLNVETSGAEFGKEEILELMQCENVLGLGEIMDFIGVINNSDRMRSILDACESEGGFLQGHIMDSSVRELCAYMCGGPESDHESEYTQEALDKLRLGMYVNARENSMSLNMEAVINALKDLPTVPSNLTMCTDDIEPSDLVEYGHMNFVVNSAIKYGLEPIEAIKAATLNIAREMGIRNLGALAPGYGADVLLVSDLHHINPDLVISKGQIVAENGKLVTAIENKPDSLETINTININELNVDMFRLKAPIQNGSIKTRVIHYLNIENSYTESAIEEIPVVNGYVDISHDSNLKFVSVVNRHGINDNQSIGIVRNIGIHKGTIGTTVSHDSHNLVLVYSTPEEALLASQELKKYSGGIICVLGSKILGLLELPILGIISPLECDQLIEQIQVVKEAHRELGLIERKNPLLRAAIIALPVIPEIKISDMGLVSVSTCELLPLYPDHPDFAPTTTSKLSENIS